MTTHTPTVIVRHPYLVTCTCGDCNVSFDTWVEAVTVAVQHYLHPTERTTAMLTTSTLYRVEGHAGLWYYDGPAVVETDDDQFEHPDLVLVHQAADPTNVLVVEPSLVTSFVVADTEPVAVTA